MTTGQRRTTVVLILLATAAVLTAVWLATARRKTEARKIVFLGDTAYVRKPTSGADHFCLYRALADGITRSSGVKTDEKDVIRYAKQGLATTSNTLLKETLRDELESTIGKPGVMQGEEVISLVSERIKTPVVLLKDDKTLQPYVVNQSNSRREPIMLYFSGSIDSGHFESLAPA